MRAPTINTPKRTRLRSASTGLAVALFVALPAGIVIGSQFRAADRLGILTAEPTAILMTPQIVEDDGARAVRLEFELDVSDRLVAPTWTGLITGVSVQPEAVIVSGDVVVSIDGIDRIALATPAPLYRDLESGMTGPDVDAVQQFLIDEQFLVEASGKYDFNMGVAVKAFRQSIGEVKPPNRFDRSLVVWLPRDRWAVGKVLVTTGNPAPTAGQAIFESLPTVTSTRLVELNDEAVSGVDAEWLIDVDGVDITLDSDGTVNPRDFGQLDAIARKTAAKSVAGADNGPSGPPLALAARLFRAESTSYLMVPASAVVTESDGTSCIWTAGEPFDPSTATAVVVGVAGSGPNPGTANIASTALPGLVLANPTAVLANSKCR